MNNLKKFLFIIIIIILSESFGNNTRAEDLATVNLTIRDGDSIIFENIVPLQPAGTIELNGHSLNADSVLSILNDADISSENFSITDLQYYDSFGSFYLKCINSKCDNWQYVVNDTAPGIGMDQKILIGGEEIYVYFGPQHKITLSSNSITIEEILTVNAENYIYQDNGWKPLTEATIGITQPDPNDSWTPIEIQTIAVDDNGQAIFSLIPTGSYNVGIKEDFYYPTESLTVTNAPLPSSRSSSGNSNKRRNKNEGKVLGAFTETKFDLNKALDFLVAQQKEDGNFGEEIYTDWATLALMSSEKYQDSKIKLIKYYSTNKIKSKLLTDYERHAMALMAFGLNPYNVSGVNYIEKITAGFDGKQFGDSEQINDDIFALIVFQNAGFEENEKIITDTINFIISKQKENGSWDESIDLTGAGMEALAKFKENEIIKNSLEKAKKYLKQNQKENGSWENVSSTAWAMEGILALGEKIENSTLEYLGENQDIDGGIKDENIQNKIWQTAYAISASSGKTWNEIMQKFEKPEETKEITPAVINSPLENKIENSHQNTFTKKITKFQKSAPKENLEISNSVVQENISPPEPIKKKNFFRRLWERIFGL